MSDETTTPESLTPSEWREHILERIKVMRVTPGDVLVWRLPLAVLNDAEEMERAKVIANEFAEVCRLPIVILEEGTDLKAEHLPQPRSAIQLPHYLQPRNGR